MMSGTVLTLTSDLSCPSLPPGYKGNCTQTRPEPACSCAAMVWGGAVIGIQMVQSLFYISLSQVSGSGAGSCSHLTDPHPHPRCPLGKELDFPSPNGTAGSLKMNPHH